MSDTNDDPVIQHLQARKAELEAIAHDTVARLSELENLLAKLGDGRTRVRRRLRDASPAVPEPPAEEQAA